MKISIDTEVLSKYKLSLGEFLVMLMGYCNINYKKYYNELVEKKAIFSHLFEKMGIVMPEESNQLVENILIESDDRIYECGIEDFEDLAKKLQEIYPKGIKAGTTYLWRDTTEKIVQKLRALVVLYNFKFTEEEAINATKEYVNSFKDKQYMALLKYFILRTTEEDDVNSMFMTIIENKIAGTGF